MNVTSLLHLSPLNLPWIFITIPRLFQTLSFFSFLNEEGISLCVQSDLPRRLPLPNWLTNFSAIALSVTFSNVYHQTNPHYFSCNLQSTKHLLPGRRWNYRILIAYYSSINSEGKVANRQTTFLYIFTTVYYIFQSFFDNEVYLQQSII